MCRAYESYWLIKPLQASAFSFLVLNLVEFYTMMDYKKALYETSN